MVLMTSLLGSDARDNREHADKAAEQNTPDLNNNPVVRHNMKLVGRLWSDEEEEDAEVQLDADRLANPYLENQPEVEIDGDIGDGFEAVVSKSQKKKLRKKSAQKKQQQGVKTRFRGGRIQFA